MIESNNNTEEEGSQSQVTSDTFLGSLLVVAHGGLVAGEFNILCIA